MKGDACFLNISIQESAIHMKASADWISIQANQEPGEGASVNYMKLTAQLSRPLRVR